MHGNLPTYVAGDLLLIAGDICPNFSGDRKKDAKKQFRWFRDKFQPWMDKYPADHIVYVAGNHDWMFVEFLESEQDGRITYLRDASTTINGLVIYGTPRQLPFCRWAYNTTEEDLTRIFKDTIPEHVDIIVSHGPPYGILDLTIDWHQTGSFALRHVIETKKPKLLVCGHIHEEHGIKRYDETIVVNASLLDDQYQMVNKPIVITDIF